MATIYENIILSGNAIILLGTLIVGLVVLYQWSKRKMGNLLILGLLYLSTSGSKIIQFAFGLVWAQIAYFQTAIPLLILEFTRRTFYKDRDDKRGLTAFFYMTTVASYVVSAYFAFQFTASGLEDRSLYNVGAFFDILTVLLANTYTIIASVEAIGQLDPKLVEGYIIARLRLWMYLSVILSIGYFMWVVELFAPGDVTYAILNTISMVVGLIHMIGSYLLWVLPAGFKEYLNRNSQVQELETEDIDVEALEVVEELPTEAFQGDMLKFLGSRLAKYLVTSELACRGHLRIAARKLYPDLSVQEFNYGKWSSVLGDPLVQQISRLSHELSSEEISNNMQDDLRNSQAILTMSV